MYLENILLELLWLWQLILIWNHIRWMSSFMNDQLFQEIYRFQHEDFEITGKDHICRLKSIMALNKPHDMFLEFDGL